MAYHALMRVISVNVCGIRSAAAKGLFRWLRRQNADFICLQETRSHEDQLAEHDVQLPGYQGFFCDAERKGSAGPHRQASKFRFLDAFEDHLARLRRRRRHYILGGDWNIAHRAIDLTN